MFVFFKFVNMYKIIMDNCGIKFYGNRSVFEVRRSSGKVIVKD